MQNHQTMKRFLIISFLLLNGIPLIVSCDQKEDLSWADTLCLNEINGVDGQKSIELYNFGEQEVSLKNWEIVIESGNEKSTWKSDTVVIRAHEYKVIRAESDSEEITERSIISSELNILSNNKTINVELINPGGSKSDSFKRGEEKAVLNKVDGSFARSSDNGNTWLLMSPTIGRSNNNAEKLGKISSSPIVGSIVLNDIQTNRNSLKVSLAGNVDGEMLYVTLLCNANLSDFAPQGNQWEAFRTVAFFEEDSVIFFGGLALVPARYVVQISDELGYARIIEDRVFIFNPNSTKFVDARLPDDNCVSENPTYYPVSALWDGYGYSRTPHFFASHESPRPCWLTINLGQTASLTHILTLPRIAYGTWRGSQVRSFEFWGWGMETDPDGSNDSDNPHSFQSGWVLLGEFSQEKPSEYGPDGSVTTITPEDIASFNAGNTFVLDASKWPHANDPVRYLRVVFVDTFDSFNTEDSKMSVQVGEVTPISSAVN